MSVSSPLLTQIALSFKGKDIVQVDLTVRQLIAGLVLFTALFSGYSLPVVLSSSYSLQKGFTIDSSLKMIVGYEKIGDVLNAKKTAFTFFGSGHFSNILIFTSVTVALYALLLSIFNSSSYSKNPSVKKSYFLALTVITVILYIPMTACEQFNSDFNSETDVFNYMKTGDGAENLYTVKSDSGEFIVNSCTDTHCVISGLQQIYLKPVIGSKLSLNLIQNQQFTSVPLDIEVLDYHSLQGLIFDYAQPFYSLGFVDGSSSSGDSNNPLEAWKTSTSYYNSIGDLLNCLDCPSDKTKLPNILKTMNLDSAQSYDCGQLVGNEVYYQRYVVNPNFTTGYIFMKTDTSLVTDLNLKIKFGSSQPIYATKSDLMTGLEIEPDVILTLFFEEEPSPISASIMCDYKKLSDTSYKIGQCYTTNYPSFGNPSLSKAGHLQASKISTSSNKDSITYFFGRTDWLQDVYFINSYDASITQQNDCHSTASLSINLDKVPVSITDDFKKLKFSYTSDHVDLDTFNHYLSTTGPKILGLKVLLIRVAVAAVVTAVTVFEVGNSKCCTTEKFDYDFSDFVSIPDVMRKVNDTYPNFLITLDSPGLLENGEPVSNSFKVRNHQGSSIGLALSASNYAVSVNPSVYTIQNLVVTSCVSANSGSSGYCTINFLFAGTTQNVPYYVKGATPMASTILAQPNGNTVSAGIMAIEYGIKEIEICLGSRDGICATGPYSVMNNPDGSNDNLGTNQGDISDARNFGDLFKVNFWFALTYVLFVILCSGFFILAVLIGKNAYTKKSLIKYTIALLFMFTFVDSSEVSWIEYPNSSNLTMKSLLLESTPKIITENDFTPCIHEFKINDTRLYPYSQVSLYNRSYDQGPYEQRPSNLTYFYPNYVSINKPFYNFTSNERRACHNIACNSTYSTNIYNTKNKGYTGYFSGDIDEINLRLHSHFYSSDVSHRYSIYYKHGNSSVVYCRRNGTFYDVNCFRTSVSELENKMSNGYYCLPTRIYATQSYEGVSYTVLNNLLLDLYPTNSAFTYRPGYNKMLACYNLTFGSESNLATTHYYATSYGTLRIKSTEEILQDQLFKQFENTTQNIYYLERVYKNTEFIRDDTFSFNLETHNIDDLIKGSDEIKRISYEFASKNSFSPINICDVVDGFIGGTCSYSTSTTRHGYISNCFCFKSLPSRVFSIDTKIGQAHHYFNLVKSQNPELKRTRSSFKAFQKYFNLHNKTNEFRNYFLNNYLTPKTLVQRDLIDFTNKIITDQGLVFDISLGGNIPLNCFSGNATLSYCNGTNLNTFISGLTPILGTLSLPPPTIFVTILYNGQPCQGTLIQTPDRIVCNAECCVYSYDDWKSFEFRLINEDIGKIKNTLIKNQVVKNMKTLLVGESTQRAYTEPDNNCLVDTTVPALWECSNKYFPEAIWIPAGLAMALIVVTIGLSIWSIGLRNTGSVVKKYTKKAYDYADDVASSFADWAKKTVKDWNTENKKTRLNIMLKSIDMVRSSPSFDTMSLTSKKSLNLLESQIRGYLSYYERKGVEPTDSKGLSLSQASSLQDRLVEIVKGLNSVDEIKVINSLPTRIDSEPSDKTE